jgi:NAD(P)-dependent dehydrogenase (short-subunit alcohol dehydrogenase family)
MDVEPGGDLGITQGRVPPSGPGDSPRGVGMEPWASTVPAPAAPAASEDRGPGWYPWLDIALAVMAAVLLVEAVERVLDGDWQRVAYTGTVGAGFLIQVSLRRRLREQAARRREGA